MEIMPDLSVLLWTVSSLPPLSQLFRDTVLPILFSSPKVIAIDNLDIRQEFLEGETVAVLATKWAGSRGVVVGYSQDNRAVKVKITDPISDIPK